MVYLLREKSITLKAPEKFLTDSSSLGVVKRLRANTDTYFTLSNFWSLIEKNKLKQELSAPCSPLRLEQLKGRGEILT